jgi:hypothetical protein
MNRPERPQIAIRFGARFLLSRRCRILTVRLRCWHPPLPEQGYANSVRANEDPRQVAALTFMKAQTRHGSPEAITTDGIRLQGRDERARQCREQEIGRWSNNRVENSHLPFRRRDRAMLRFRRMRSLQKFSSVHANVHDHFNLERRLVDRQTVKERRTAALLPWRGVRRMDRVMPLPSIRSVETSSH